MSYVNVSDPRSNSIEHLEHAAKIIGRSRFRLKVFESVYKGKSPTKTVSEICAATGFDKKEVLTAGKALASNHIVVQTKVEKETAYQKDAFYAAHKVKIIQYVNNPKKLEKLATKRRPQGDVKVEVIGNIPKGAIQVKELFLDNFDSFKSVPKSVTPTIDLKTISETKFKEGFQKIIGEKGIFKDWGGEINDLMTTNMMYEKNRIRTAIAFKGPGTTGKLTPKKMGKNGDQIPRLFRSPADLYILQYHDQIDQSVVDLMKTYAEVTSVKESKKVFFCIIDGADTQRIVETYSRYFK